MSDHMAIFDGSGFVTGNAHGRVQMALKAAEAERDRLRGVLEAIELHRAMPAGEPWQAAYVEVTTMAREALR